MTTNPKALISDLTDVRVSLLKEYYCRNYCNGSFNNLFFVADDFDFTVIFSCRSMKVFLLYS